MNKRKYHLTPYQRRVLNLIPEGIEKPAKVADISRILKKKDDRSVNSVINRLTAKGVPICSLRIGDNKGVFIATNEYERAIGLVSYEHQKNDMERRIYNVRTADLKHWKSKIS